MSIKDFFKTGVSADVIAPAKSLDDLGRRIDQGEEHFFAHEEQKDRFVPHVDFGTASNFARYGSAEQYYEDAIKRIYKTYPYDGSAREKIEWQNLSSYIDKHIFDKEYPRTNGYINLSAGGWGTLSGSLVEGYGSPGSSDLEYVQFKGGPHPDRDASTVVKSFPGLHEGKANFYDEDTSCLLYTSPSPRDRQKSRMPSSA